MTAYACSPNLSNLPCFLIPSLRATGKIILKSVNCRMKEKTMMWYKMKGMSSHPFAYRGSSGELEVMWWDMNSIGLNGLGWTLRASRIAYNITGIIKSLKEEAIHKAMRKWHILCWDGLTRHPHPSQCHYVIEKAFRIVEIIMGSFRHNTWSVRCRSRWTRGANKALVKTNFIIFLVSNLTSVARRGRWGGVAYRLC